MDSEATERVINRITSVALAGMLMLFAYFVKESLSFVTGIVGGVILSVTGAEIANRTKRQTLKKVEENTRRPPPPDDNDDGSGTTLASEPPPPPVTPRRRDPRRFATALAVFLLVAGLACAGSNPAAAVYSAERLRCVHEASADAPDSARDCMREVDRRYGQDGGL